MSDTDYSIWSLEFCHVDMPMDFFGGSVKFSNAGTARIPMLYTLLIGGEVGGRQHVALVDCGFRDDYSLERHDFSDWEDPARVLEPIGITPADVDVILITHMHFDHVGNFEAFPNATLFVQYDEFVGWSSAMELARAMETDAEREWLFSSFDPTDLTRAARGIADGRIRFVRGDEEVIPGVTARLAKDSHTFGSQLFRIETRSGPFVAAGDTVYWYSNIEQVWTPGYVQGNAYNLITLYSGLKRELQRETSRVIPGHDPEIARRYPSWVTESGNSITEINLREDDASRRPFAATQLFR